MGRVMSTPPSTDSPRLSTERREALCTDADEERSEAYIAVWDERFAPIPTWELHQPPRKKTG